MNIKHANLSSLSLWLRRFVAFMLIAAILLSFGCASGMSKEECQSADWELIGYGDGSKGYSSSQIDRHRKDCAGISSPVLSLYLKGHQRGLVSFCTEINGYKSGKRGSAMNSACNDFQGELFHTGYEFGHRVYVANRDVNRLIKQLTNTKQQRVDIEQRVIELEADILRPGLSPSQRADILLRIKHKRDKINDLDDKIDMQEGKLRKRIAKLNAVNENNPYENLPPRDMPDIQVTAKTRKVHHDRRHGRNGNKSSEPRIVIETSP